MDVPVVTANMQGEGGKGKRGKYIKGEYHCTIDLLFYWFGLVCLANKNKNCHLSYS